MAAEQALTRRFDHCHPSWEKEKILLIKEMEQLEDDQPLFWSDGWVSDEDDNRLVFSCQVVVLVYMYCCKFIQ